ncbi:hypothetical protein ATANTOWER_027607 [Ataeniobius toweri]|uniref:Uncharacterized protein n=1 Tax=Ataeniobius toweri TaxID=208326 RepID=A0ABU7BKW6_9TELE|nr:hypothetical protein [Ataeniobius toweri]
MEQRGGGKEIIRLFIYKLSERGEGARLGILSEITTLGRKKRLHAAVKVADVPLVLILLLFTCMGASTDGYGVPTTGLHGASSCGRVNINTPHKKTGTLKEIQTKSVSAETCVARCFIDR